VPRYFLALEYDGAGFCGWQKQQNGLAVQTVVETAVERLCGEPRPVQAAGRTDAGVHALGQVAHVDLPKDYGEAKVRDALNHHLRPHPVAVLAARRVAADAHARFDAIGRAYLYRIRNRRPPLTLEADRAWQVPQPLDAAAMAEAAAGLVGRHDFSSFRAAECQAESAVKTLDRLTVRRREDVVEIEAAARSFLHHQVRNIVGTLVLVGKGAWTVADARAALAAKRRSAAGPTAPAAGLYLTRVDYPLTCPSPDAGPASRPAAG
jgi:tRNA pseudouridine38-40 synthase